MRPLWIWSQSCLRSPSFACRLAFYAASWGDPRPMPKGRYNLRSWGRICPSSRSRFRGLYRSFLFRFYEALDLLAWYAYNLQRLFGMAVHTWPRCPLLRDCRIDASWHHLYLWVGGRRWGSCNCRWPWGGQRIDLAWGTWNYVYWAPIRIQNSWSTSRRYDLTRSPCWTSSSTENELPLRKQVPSLNQIWSNV
jgi:hypothetical protein